MEIKLQVLKLISVADEYHIVNDMLYCFSCIVSTLVIVDVNYEPGSLCLTSLMHGRNYYKLVLLTVTFEITDFDFCLLAIEAEYIELGTHLGGNFFFSSTIVRLYC